MVTFLEISPPTKLTKNRCKDNVYLFSQFFIHKDEKRNEEIKHCLKQNVANTYIKQIVLLNEKIYSDEELGVTSEKIKQIDMGKRLKFSHVFDYVLEKNIKGYIAIANVDIFFTPQLNRLQMSDIHEEKKAFALLRHEYRGHEDLKKASLFGSQMSLLEMLKDEQKEVYEKVINDNNVHKDFFIQGARADSWDAWIIHSDFMISKQENKAFNFELGRIGCDNKMIYLLKTLGYTIYNDPLWVPIYHYHTDQNRDYTRDDRLPDPYGLYIPARTNIKQTPSSLGVDIQNVLHTTNQLNYLHFSDDNTKFGKFIKEKLDTNKTFIIPRIAGEENNFAFFTRMMVEGKIPQNDETNKLLRYHILKNNAGVKMTSFESAKKYSELYFKAFEHSELYSVWEPWGAVYRAIQQSHDYVLSTFQQEKVWAFAFDVYHYLHNPWTWALRGKRLLIISPFEDSMKEKINKRKEIYGVDLFPECEFVFIKPPQTQGTQESREFDVELCDFYKKLELMKDEFDVALCSCGGYGNLVCDYIYSEMNKSAIYVGGVLQMYFGIYGSRWVRERQDILRIHLNEHWSRPNNNEKPKDFQKVEGSCYW